MNQDMKPPKPRTFEEWLPTLPAETRALIEKFPAETCCKVMDDPLGHFIIASYGQNHTTGEIFATLMQGKDSRWPGMACTEPLERLEPCGCGAWEPPTAKQRELMRKHFEYLHEAQELGGYMKRAEAYNEKMRQQRLKDEKSSS